MRTAFILNAAFALSLAAPAYAQHSGHTADDAAAPPWSMADKYWGEQVMAASRLEVLHHHGALQNYMILGDRLEWQDTSGGGLLWDVQGWYGGDINKLYIKTEGEFSLEDNEVEDLEVQALWSRAITPFWDVQAGVRYDLAPKGRTYAVLGVQGLAPYWFEVDAAAFLSTEGNLSASLEAEYDLHVSQRLVLQPRTQISLSAQDIPEIEIGSGLVGVDAGVRLRYEIKREFAPYIGVEWQQRFGRSKDLIQASGGDPSKAFAIIGLRAWY